MPPFSAFQEGVEFIPQIPSFLFIRPGRGTMSGFPLPPDSRCGICPQCASVSLSRFLRGPVNPLRIPPLWAHFVIAVTFPPPSVSAQKFRRRHRTRSPAPLGELRPIPPPPPNALNCYRLPSGSFLAWKVSSSRPEDMFPVP